VLKIEFGEEIILLGYPIDTGKNLVAHAMKIEDLPAYIYIGLFKLGLSFQDVLKLKFNISKPIEDNYNLIEEIKRTKPLEQQEEFENKAILLYEWLTALNKKGLINYPSYKFIHSGWYNLLKNVNSINELEELNLKRCIICNTLFTTTDSRTKYPLCEKHKKHANKIRVRILRFYREKKSQLEKDFNNLKIPAKELHEKYPLVFKGLK
jgi:hypothetical protein